MEGLIGSLIGYRAVAFTDGSYCNGIEVYAFSIYVDLGDKLRYVLEESGRCSLFTGLKNVSGEIEAVYRACELAQKMCAAHVKVFTDYIVCKELAYGNWKPRSYANLLFVDSMRKLRIPYTIEVIKGHSGNDFHNVVDRLAKAEARKAAAQIL